MSLFGQALNFAMPAVGFMTNGIAAQLQRQQQQQPAQQQQPDQPDRPEPDPPRERRPAPMPAVDWHPDVMPGAFARSLLAQEEHGRRYGEMIDKVNDAWKSEMDRRVEQAAEERKWQHLENMEAIRAQAHAGQQEPPAYQEPLRPQRRLVSTFFIDGAGNSFLNGSPIRSSLLS